MVNSRSGFVLTEKSVNFGDLVDNCFFEESLFRWLWRGICGSFFSGSGPLALNSSSKCNQMATFLFKMMKISLKRHHYFLNTHFDWEKLSFDYFLMTTWEREVDSQKKKEPQIPRLDHDKICSQKLIWSTLWENFLIDIMKNINLILFGMPVSEWDYQK